MTKRKPQKTRCAIYTRKSSEEGLEQEFNSLDAQREACEAYIQSQKHEGWIALPDLYDDGGFSGGSMKRPALERLLEGIRAKNIDVIVVYKIDRLTRSLADFAKMVELFDERGVSFVSVTQQFNTKTSMGRLTLNVLLSFAQFEREVTGERIRDKIAASKKKGMWMGGNLPMGYDVEERELIINERDAETVRHIYRCYIELGSVSLLKNDLDRDGITSPVRVAASTGNRSGGRPLARGALYKMLSNRIYLGEITHKEDSYPGNHKAILDQELWDRVQEKLQSNSVNRRNRTNAKRPSPLAGLLFDGENNRFTPTHANKNGKHYRYYASPSQSLPAGDIEGVVISRLQALLGNGTELLDTIETLTNDVAEQKALLDSGRQLADEWSKLQPSEIKAIITGSVTRIEVHEDKLDIHIDPHGLHHVFRKSINNIPPATNSDDLIILSIKAGLKRRGMEMKMVVSDGSAITQTGPDHTLLTTIIKAHSWWNKLTSGEVKSIRELAEVNGTGERYVSRVLKLVFLAPEIIEAIMAGEQPANFSVDQLVNPKCMPSMWLEQTHEFNFYNRT